jgi:hypothetical protein
MAAISHNPTQNTSAIRIHPQPSAHNQTHGLQEAPCSFIHCAY